MVANRLSLHSRQQRAPRIYPRRWLAAPLVRLRPPSQLQALQRPSSLPTPTPTPTPTVMAATAKGMRVATGMG